MATIQSWGLPTDPIELPIIGKIWLGDHTWVTADDRRCWRVLGGTDDFYCGSSRWQGNTYIPPTIQFGGRPVTGRELSRASGETNKTNCMGGSETWFFGKLPVYADIIYGVHGVCHQMANRLLLSCGSTVANANGFVLSAANYGIYGTRVPAGVWAAAAWVPPFFAALVGYSAGMNIAFGVRCAACGVRYPGPIVAEAGATPERKLALAVWDLHQQAAPTLRPFDPQTASRSDWERNFSDGLDLHLRELGILFDYASGGKIASDKLERVRGLYREFHQLPPDLLDAIVEAAGAHGRAGAPPVELTADDAERFALETNRIVLEQQRKVADALGAADYEALFGVGPEVNLGLVDPRILKGQATVARPTEVGAPA
jgi:hypothetical protein